ncbi:DNA polymerase IV [Lysobacter sp. SG-8]|uniref:DNA polymerase IV n=1 Tax=Marilutibacter penaei TaxID=2759900 RepID=A0A7W3YDU3_9GAMM|nr:DNA polymerase IV [Lysobacter penaei]MBB1087511.1 DNA polymerase IV [Lysobacter penaei]
MPIPLRKIVHVDMDAFYASVEQRDDPSLRGRPVVVAWRGARSVVCAASYEARRFGVRSAMPALRAERLCPDAVFVPPDFPRYKAVSRQVREIFARHTDLVEPLSLDEAYLDVSETRTGMPSATATAQAIRDAIREETGLTASAGIAPNKFLAKIASDWRKPDGQFVIRPRDVEAFLQPLPVGRLPGVGKVGEKRLSELGVTTVGGLRELPLETLEAAFGRWGARLHRLARGIDDNPVQPERPTMQVSSEDTFAEDLALEALAPRIRDLARKTWDSYQRHLVRDPDRRARTVVLKLKTADFRTLTRSLTLAALPDDADGLAEVACELRGRVDLPMDTLYRLVGVGVSGFIEADAAAQSDLFGPRAGQRG